MNRTALLASLSLTFSLATLSLAASAQTIEWTAGQLGGGWYTIVSGVSKMVEEKPQA